MKQKLTVLKEETDNSTIIVKGFVTPLSTWIEQLIQKAERNRLSLITMKIGNTSSEDRKSVV